MSATFQKLARFSAILLLPLLGCMADVSDAGTDDVEIDEQSEALSFPCPRPLPYPPGSPVEPAIRIPPWCDPCASVRCAEGTHCEEVVCVRAPCPPICVPDEQPRPDPDAPSCGGLGSFPCPGMGECVENPYDNCDSKNGGADCSGLCVCTANANCAPGFEWDGSAEVCDCVATR